jgi:hypothetical protein
LERGNVLFEKRPERRAVFLPAAEQLYVSCGQCVQRRKLRGLEEIGRDLRNVQASLPVAIRVGQPLASFGDRPGDPAFPVGSLEYDLGAAIAKEAHDGHWD